MGTRAQPPGLHQSQGGSREQSSEVALCRHERAQGAKSRADVLLEG